MKQWSVARHDDRDGTELYHCIVLETQTSDRDVSGLRQTETDGWTDISKKRGTRDAKDKVVQEASGQMQHGTPLYVESCVHV